MPASDGAVLVIDDDVDILTPLRAGATDQELCDLIRAGVYSKPKGHRLTEHYYPHDHMSSIGG